MSDGGLLSLGSGVLPARLTALIGRDAEVTELVRLVGRERLLTLVGAPGCGKTRLALEVAAGVEPGFAGGVRFVELAPIGAPGSIAHAVGVALGVPEQPGQQMLDSLVEALGSADPVLVVLDNCEHIVDAVAAVAQRLVSVCSSLSVLATSRAALAVPGERAWSVPPLDVDAAVELFVERARSVCGAGATDVGPADRAVVEEICARLGGLPLAIELAAAWSRVLSPQQILDRLTLAATWAPGSGRGRDSRHDTMAAAVDWSYRLLPAPGQLLFRRLSVFAGSFDLDAVDAVAGHNDADGENGQAGEADEGVLGPLTLLVDHSLVLTERVAGEQMRYRMLEPVRQFAEALLADAGDQDTVRRRHFDHYLDLAERCDVLGSPRSPQPLRLDQLAPDEGNLLAAFEWAGRQPGDLGLRLGTALVEHFVVSGRVNDGRRWLHDLLAKGCDDQGLYARALAAVGVLAWRQGDYEPARLRHEEALAIADRIGDPLLRAVSLHGLAFAEYAAGDITSALAHGHEALDLARARDDERAIAAASLALGWANYAQGDPAAGDEHMRTGLEANRHIGDPFVTGHAHLGLQFGACLVGDAEAQRVHLVAALDAMGHGANVQRTDWLWAGVTLAAQEGRSHAIARLMGAIGAMERRQGGTRPPAELAAQFAPLVTRALQDVSPALVDRLVEHGRHMQWDDLVTEILTRPGAGLPSTLTRREHEIAGLVAQGMTNVEIADKLVISRRTVESHIDHIRQKLGLSSRNMIIVWVLQESSSTHGA